MNVSVLQAFLPEGVVETLASVSNHETHDVKRHFFKIAET